jgi:FkbM family methyltransferase
MSYSYDYFHDTCLQLKKAGFNSKSYLDIGASNCQTSDIVRQVWPQSDILLIEANEEFENLYKTKNYKYILKCLGKENGETNFYKTKKHKYSTGNSIYREISDDFNNENIIIENKKIYKLDSITDNIFDFIKIDTQGSELDIINGGIRTILNTKVIIVEISLKETNMNGCLGEQVIDKLNNLKFDFIFPIENIYSNTNEIMQQSLLFIKK